MTKQFKAPKNKGFADVPLKKEQSSTTYILNDNIKNIVSEPDLKVFFTKDKDLLDQYYDLRLESYRKEWGFEKFNERENDFDRSSRIALAVLNGKVIGGMRLMVSDECKYLSNEVPGTQYEYRKVIRLYDSRKNMLMSEISAIVIDEKFRDGTVSTHLFDLVLGEAKRIGCHYVFGVTLPVLCRRYRLSLKKINYDIEIVMNYPWDKKKLYNYKNMFPMYFKMC